MFSTLYDTYFSSQMHFKSLLNDIILDLSKLKAYADDI